MRIVVPTCFGPASLVLLAGCVQQGYVPPGPIQLQPYGPAIPYRTAPYDRPYADPAAPLPAPIPLDTPSYPPPETQTTPPDDAGPIPLQDMPPPATPDTPANPPPTAAKPQDAAPAPVVQRRPTTGPGSNVPLEGFRPMHSQTRPTP